MQPEIRYRTDQPLVPEQLQVVWNALQEDLRKTLGESTFEFWFAESRLVQVDKNRALISSPGSMYAIWIEENFRDILKANLSKYLEGLKGFSIVCSNPVMAPEDETAETSSPSPEAHPKEETRPAATDRRERKTRKARRPLTDEELHQKGREAGLNETYRFSTFISGSHCALAAASAQAVVERPGSLYQPLFLHAGSGMGKTHLLHAMGWAFLELRHHAEIRYVTAEKFANEYIEAIRHSRETAFRKKYREVDLLLIDDVQFLGGKSGFQTEFFHTFNSIVDQRNQIVIASECLASEIKQLEERLVSRLQWGMTVHIGSPDEATRMAILSQKRDQWHLELDDAILAKIIARVSKNVRQLEGALVRASMVAFLGNGTISDQQLDEALADLADCHSDHAPGIEEIKQAVAEHFEVTVKEIEGKRRTTRISEARQAAFFLCREMTDYSLKDIAVEFAKDHSSVIYSVKAVKAKLEKSETLRNSLEMLRRSLLREGRTANRPEKRPRADRSAPTTTRTNEANPRTNEANPKTNEANPKTNEANPKTNGDNRFLPMKRGPRGLVSEREDSLAAFLG